MLRVIYYIAEYAAGGDHMFSVGSWYLYVAVAVASLFGATVGGFLFQRMKDAQAQIKGALACLLVLNGASMIVAGFVM